MRVRGGLGLSPPAPQARHLWGFLHKEPVLLGSPLPQWPFLQGRRNENTFNLLLIEVKIPESGGQAAGTSWRAVLLASWHALGS